MAATSLVLNCSLVKHAVPSVFDSNSEGRDARRDINRSTVVSTLCMKFEAYWFLQTTRPRF